MGGCAVKLPEHQYAKLPPHLQALFRRLPNPGSEEVLDAFPDARAAGDYPSNARSGGAIFAHVKRQGPLYADGGSASRFFYSAKADADDRCDSKHPTVKPVSLMRWLVRLITPPGGLVLDPFAGSGTTGVACIREGFDCILIEREDQYVKDIRHRLNKLHGGDTPLFAGAAS
jgi:site-specific DNA-methyltransferase (adenine-specific)